MRRGTALTLIILLPVAGAALGHLLGPTLARTNYTVQLAARLWQEERLAAAGTPPAQRALETEAFRLTGGGDVAALFARAESVVRTFRLGSVFFGIWAGLVVGFQLLGLANPPRRTEFEVEHAWCVSCGRCYRWCPRERLRIKRRQVQGGSMP